MNKKEVLASIIEIANEFDSMGAYENADILTNVGQRLAQFDDFDDFERPDDYNTYEERQLDLDDERFDRDEENGGSYDTESDAMSAIRRQQAGYANEPYVMLIDFDGDDDRRTSYDVMPRSKYEENGHWMQLYKDIQPGTQEELSPYLTDMETETPFGMELDGGFDDFSAD